jgi:cytochrome c oxidase cbb3-type subunit I/II
MKVDSSLVRAHGYAALGTLLLSVIFGLIASIQLWWPDLGAGVPALSWGRIRYAHTQGIMFGWLGNAFLAFLYYAVPALSGRPVTSARLGHWLFGIWNLGVMLPGWTLVLAGVSQPLEWAEFPLVVDLFVGVAFILAIIQFVPGFFRKGLESLYVSSWYVMGALVFTALAYPMGNVVPEFVPGAAGAAFSGLWIHDAVGLFVTPLALAILYFVIPAVTGKPIYSHRLSMLGFWLLFFLYPLNGTHHYVMSVIPMPAQYTAIAASGLLGLTVILVVANLLLSLRGAGVFPKDIGLRFVVMSTILYLIVSIQGALQAFMSVNAVVHFTDWVIGHSHLAMLGFASFAAAGGLLHAWRRTPGCRFNAAAAHRAYWLVSAGLALMVTVLTVGGLIQAQLWQSAAPWLDSVTASRQIWIVRSVSGLLIAAGFIELLRAMLTSDWTTDVDADVAATLEPSTRHAHAGAGLTGARMAYASVFVAGIACFVFSVVSLGVVPARTLKAVAAAEAPSPAFALTQSELRGRAVYAREGCAYCHTQQVRLTDADRARFGEPTMAWESRQDYPQMMGTRRIGPDLSRSSGTRSADWQLAHLFEPRAVVAESVMPAYRHLFEGAATAPKQEARDVVAYLETLGRARVLAEPQLASAHPGATRRDGRVPVIAEDGDPSAGRRLFELHCAGCHGVDGQGNGPGAPGLSPKPANLTGFYRQERMAQVLWHGVPGTAMPAWRDRSPTELADLAAYTRHLGVPLGTMKDDRVRPTVTPEQQADAPVLYANHCAQCHGDRGAGDGFAASALAIPPTNFRLQRGARVSDAIRNGIEGTMMGAWSTRLTEAEIQALEWLLIQFWDEAR